MSITPETEARGRELLALLLSRMDFPELLRLEEGLVADDPALIQGRTSGPVCAPGESRLGAVCDSACLVGYGAWQQARCRTVEQVEDEFARLACLLEDATGEPAAMRWVTHWWDYQDRPRARAAALGLVQAEIRGRNG